MGTDTGTGAGTGKGIRPVSEEGKGLYNFLKAIMCQPTAFRPAIFSCLMDGEAVDCVVAVRQCPDGEFEIRPVAVLVSDATVSYTHLTLPTKRIV